MSICRERARPTVANSRVVRVLRQQTQAAWRFLGFPPAGGGPMFFQPWCSALHVQFQLEAVNLPGRELRLEETLPPSVALLAAELVPLIAASFLHDPRPLLLFGHSFGGLLAYETVRLLNHLGVRHPLALCISAHCAPMHRTPVGALHLLDDRGLITELRRFDGVPMELLDNAEYLAFWLPLIRADLQLDYQATLRQDCSLCQPLLVMGGADDHVAPPELMHGWLQMSSANSAFLSWPGHHFYLRGQLRALSARLHAFAAELWPPAPRNEMSRIACRHARHAHSERKNGSPNE